MMLGVACLCGAATLAWLSSPATMHLTRTGGEAVTVAIETRLFGQFVIDQQRVDNARSVYMAEHTAPRLTFDTSRGPVDLGRAQQLFVPYFAEVKDFFEARVTVPELEGERAVEPPQSLTLSSIGSGSETIRFAIAQVMVLFLTALGAGVIWLAGRSLLGRDTTIGPR